MNELSFLVLTVLAEAPQHGYGLLQGVTDLTDGAVRPQVATLYRTVDRLESDGWVVEHSTDVVDGRFRRTYRLTEEGRTQLAAEAALRASTARIAAKRLASPTPTFGIAGGAA
jgi:DNA-binding PadR family transcriptional regulator